MLRRKYLTMRRGVWLSAFLILVLMQRISWAQGPEGAAPAAPPTATAQASEQAGGATAFDRYVVGGGWVTIGLLIPMSVAAFALVLQSLFRTRREAIIPAGLPERLCESLRRGDYAEAVQACAEDLSVLARVAYAAFQSAADGPAAVRRAMEKTSDERALALLRQLDYLNLIGHVAPMVGLFGTVHGIIGMFGSIAESGGIPVMARISHDLGTALVATFWGLMIAIPSLTGFGLLRARVERSMQECALAADEILAALQNREAATPAEAPAFAASS